MSKLYHRRRGFPDESEARPPTRWGLELSYHAADYHENGRKYVDGIDLPTGVVYRGVNSVYAVYNGDDDDDGVSLLPGYMFELETYDAGEGGLRTVSKMGVRFNYDDEHDLTIILDPLEAPDGTVYPPHSEETPVGTIISCWLNKKDDQHDTLDLSRYETVEQPA